MENETAGQPRRLMERDRVLYLRVPADLHDAVLRLASRRGFTVNHAGRLILAAAVEQDHVPGEPAPKKKPTNWG